MVKLSRQVRLQFASWSERPASFPRVLWFERMAGVLNLCPS